METTTKTNEAIKLLIQSGYNFTLVGESISYKLSQDNQSPPDKDAITATLKQLKQNKQYALAYLKSLLTMRVVLAAVEPVGHILLLVDIFDYKKQELKPDVQIFETQEKLDEYMHQAYFLNNSYEVIHSVKKDSLFFLKVSDKKKYADELAANGLDWRELTPEEKAACPWGSGGK